MGLHFFVCDQILLTGTIFAFLPFGSGGIKQIENTRVVWFFSLTGYGLNMRCLIDGLSPHPYILSFVVTYLFGMK